MQQLVVLMRPTCHLCHALVDELRLAQARWPFTFVEIDIDTDPDLIDAYGALIPVVLLDGREICRYRLDDAALRAALGE